MKILATNKEFGRSYSLVEEYEAGIVLTGNEVKSAKQGHIQMKGAYISAKNGQLWLKNTHISQYAHAAQKEKYDPIRERKLLMHKKEIVSISSKAKEKGLTLIPLSLYAKNGFVKVKIALAKGKTTRDKRAEMRKKDIDKTIRQALKKRLTIRL